VLCKLFATNIYGDSKLLAGNGAIITTKPDAPINLSEKVCSKN